MAYGQVLPMVIVNAIDRAILGNNTVLYVRTVARAHSRTRSIRAYLDRVGVTYVAQKNRFCFPGTGGHLKLAILEPELRGYREDCIYYDPIGSTSLW